MINIEWRDPLEVGNCLSHIGNKNSGRYKKGSGERPWQHVPWRRKKYKPKHLSEDNSEKKDEYAVKAFDLKKEKKQKEERKSSETKSETNTKEERQTSEKKSETNAKEKKNSMYDKMSTEAIKDDTERLNAIRENEALRDQKLSSDQTSKAASYFKGASSLTGEVTKGVDKAWNSLHDLKYADEDRSKNVRGLTNEELRKTIERIKLDQEYNRITMPPKSKGYDRTMAALGALGSVLAVTATGLTIVAGAKKIKER